MRASIRKLKSTTAAGIGGIPPEFYAGGDLDALLTALIHSTVASIPTCGVKVLSTDCINESLPFYQRTNEKYQWL